MTTTRTKNHPPAAPVTDTGNLLTLEQAAAKLGVSKPTFFRLLERGELKGLKAGRRWRFRPADLNRYLERGPVATAAAAPELMAPELDFFADALQKIGAVVPDLPADPQQTVGEQQAISLVNRIILLALRSRASDIHLEPVRNAADAYILLRFRIDGVLHETRRLPIQLHEPLVTRLKMMAAMNLSEHNLPQDGRIQLHVEGSPLDLRIAVIPSIFGEAITIRMLIPAAASLTLEQLRMPADDLARLHRWLRRPNGIILNTGPTGSGKTTVLYACLRNIAGPQHKTMSVEDPVEYILPWVTQVQVNYVTGHTMAPILRSFLRHDPDILVAGEIRDRDTMEVLIQAALTGHLAMSQLHTECAADAIRRMLDIGTEPFLVSASVIGITGQRLVRKVCPDCKKPYKPEQNWLNRAKTLASQGGYDLKLAKTIFHKGTGCPACHNTGFRGRLAIMELLELTPAVKTAILDKADSAAITALAVKEGMLTMAAQGIRLAAEGATTLEEVLRVMGE